MDMHLYLLLIHRLTSGVKEQGLNAWLSNPNEMFLGFQKGKIEGNLGAVEGGWGQLGEDLYASINLLGAGLEW